MTGNCQVRFLEDGTRVISSCYSTQAIDYLIGKGVKPEKSSTSTLTSLSNTKASDCSTVFLGNISSCMRRKRENTSSWMKFRKSKAGNSGSRNSTTTTRKKSNSCYRLEQHHTLRPARDPFDLEDDHPAHISNLRCWPRQEKYISIEFGWVKRASFRMRYSFS